MSTNPIDQWIKLETRRQFFGRSAKGLGAAALASMLNEQAAGEAAGQTGGVLGQGHFPARAKRVIWLFMAGAPSHLDTFDYKPKMLDWFDKDLPESVRQGQRLTTMTASQARFPIAPTMFRFDQHGESGKRVCELLPKTGSMADDLAFVHTVWTEAINHDPAITYIQTGNQIPGRPTLGAWISYGLNADDYWPGSLRAQIAPVNDRIYGTLNNGVYKSGFATTQSAYDAAVYPLFDTLDWLEGILAENRYLLGDRLTEADWRLFTTLVRFDLVYHQHFKCNRARIIDYPNLWAFTRELYQWPGVSETVNFDHIVRHYHYSHETINPNRIIPINTILDFDAPHGRG